MPSSNISKSAIDLLDQLKLSNLKGRPFDNSFHVFNHINTSNTIVVLGLNGSMDDDKWTNKTALQASIEDPDFSNIEYGLNKGWGKGNRTLPRRLKQCVEHLGYNYKSAIFTNSILLCSENADTIKTRVNSYNNLNLHQLIHNSFEFHKHFTFRISKPSAILIHGNSLYSMSAANFFRQAFYTSDLRFIKSTSNYNSYWFETIFDGKNIPTLCIPHMSRVPPDQAVNNEFANIIASLRV